MRNLLTLLFCLILASQATSKPTPPVIPGGANQKEGVSGAVQEWLFNGKYRLRVDRLAEATPADLDADAGLPRPDAGQKVWLLQMTLKFAQKEQDVDTIDISMADADDITQTFLPYLIVPNPTPLTVQGGAWKEAASILLPAQFVPARLVITFPSSAKLPAFRVKL